MEQISLSSPDVGDLEKKYVNEVLSGPNLSGGPFIKKFETLMCNFVKAHYCAAVSSGTAALHLIVKSLGIKKGDEVITSPYSFIATTNSILYEGAIPVFVEVENGTLNLDPNRTEAFIDKHYVRKEDKMVNTENGNILRAIMVVHIYGHPARMNRFIDIANKYNVHLIEDSAESLGSEVLLDSGNWRQSGTIGKAGVYAFYPNKQITTGEGGMVVTGDEQIYRAVLSLRNQGRDLRSRWLLHNRIGFNYRMSELAAALGLAQVERMNELMALRRKVHEIYNELLSDIDELELPVQMSYAKANWFVYVVRFKNQGIRDFVENRLREKGIPTRRYFSPCLHLQPAYAFLGYKRGDFPVAESYSDRVLALPFHNRLKKEQQQFIARELKNAVFSYIV